MPDGLGRRPVRLVAAILALALGGFGIGTAEFVSMGLLPEMADAVSVSIPQAGHVISALASGYASLVAARFATGLPHGAYFGVGALVAASLVAPRKRAQAVR
ncbi:MAG: hypothetical protein ACRDO0_15900 [Nocardioidaceae bacterium]